jgi:hypothetical protein
MGFLSRIVADSTANAPVTSAREPTAERTLAAAERRDIVDSVPAPEPSQEPSPRQPVNERSEMPPAVTARPEEASSTPRLASAHNGADALQDQEAGAPAARSLVPAAAPRSSLSPLEDSRAVTPVATPRSAGREPLATPRTPVTAGHPRSRGNTTIATSDRAEHTPERVGVPAPLPRHARADQPSAAHASDDSKPSTPGARSASRGSHADATAPATASTETPAAPVPKADEGTPALQGEPPARSLRAEAPATPTVRSQPFAPASNVEAPPSAATSEPRHRERPSPVPAAGKPVAVEPRVHIGRLEVIVAAPAEPPLARPAQRGSPLTSRRYLRNA